MSVFYYFYYIFILYFILLLLLPSEIKNQSIGHKDRICVIRFIVQTGKSERESKQGRQTGTLAGRNQHMDLADKEERLDNYLETECFREVT